MITYDTIIKIIIFLLSLTLNGNMANTIGFDKDTTPKYNETITYDKKLFPSYREYKVSSGVLEKKDLKKIYIFCPDLDIDDISFLKDEFLGVGIVVDFFYGNKLFVRDDVGDIKVADGFIVEIGNNIKVKAKNKNGIIYGLRAVIQHFYLYGNMPKGRILDYPDVAERAVHLDMGRKYYSPEWIIKLIKLMSFNRLNTLQLHFSENQGFRIQCDTYPEIVSDEHITKDEMRDIMEEANKYGVQIIPSFDNPGHMRHILSKYKEFILKDKNGYENKYAMDINNDHARQFVKNIIKEYTELFSDSKYFHIGGDEFIDFNEFGLYPSLAEYGQKKLNGDSKANGLDGYTEYINEIAAYTYSLGFIPRIWNDGVYRVNIPSKAQLNDYIQIEYWSRWDKNMASTDTFIDKGHTLINVSESLYYVLKRGFDFKPMEDFEFIYEYWDAGTFEGEQYYDIPNENVLGACYAIWSDEPDFQTEDEVYEAVYYPLTAMAEKVWAGDREDSDIEAFKMLVDKIVDLRD